MRMRVCYLDCHETGLCFYLVIHIENLSITAVLLSYVTCLLILHRNIGWEHYVMENFTKCLFYHVVLGRLKKGE
jgi:hypothetical protein